MRAQGPAIGLLLVATLFIAAFLLPITLAPASPGPSGGTARGPASTPVRVSAAGLSLALVASTTQADPKDTVVVTAYFNNTGNQAAPAIWINVSAPPGLTFRGDTATGNLTGYPRYSFANVGLGPHVFAIAFQVDVGTTPGSRLTVSATMVYADGTGGQLFVGPDSVTIAIGLETKQLYLGWSGVPARVLTPVPPTGPLLPAGTFSLTRGGPALSFDLSPVLARPFRVLNLTTTLYVEPVATPTTLNVNLTLIDLNGAVTTSVASMEQTNSVTGPGFWTLIYTFPALDYSFAAGHALRLQILNTAASGESALLATNATAEPSHLDLVTTTYVRIDSLLPAGPPTTFLSPRSSLIVSANASDPFGSAEIVDARLNVTGPSGQVVVWASLLPAAQTDPSSPSGWKLFRYTLAPPLANGTYAFEVTAVERNGVTDVAASSVVVRAPAFTLSKVASVAQAKSGAKFTYSVWYNNTGSGPAGTTWVNDTLPADVTFLSSSPAYSTLVGTTYGWTFASVSVGSHVITISVQVKGGASGVAYVRNVATLALLDPQGFSWPGMSSHADVVINGPALSLSITSVPSAFLHSNQTVVYTFHLTNAGDAAQSIWLNDTLPAGTTYVSDTAVSLGGTRTVVGDQVNFVFANMPSGNPTPVTWTFTLTARAALGLPGGAVLMDRAMVNDTSTNGVLMPETGASLSLIVGAPYITTAIVEFQVSAAVPNVPLPVRVNFTNSGNEQALVVWLNLTLSPRLAFLDASVPANVAGSSVGLVLSNAPTGHNSVSLNVSAAPTVMDRDVLTIAATLDATDGYGNPLPSVTGTPGLITVSLPEVSFTLTPPAVTAEANTTVMYTIDGGNMGSGTASNVWLNVTLPAALLYVSDTVTGTRTVVGSDYSWFWQDFAPGLATYTLTVTVSPQAADGTAADLAFLLQAQDLGHNPQPDITFSGRTNVVAPAFDLTVAADRGTAPPASTFNYSLTAANHGTTAAHELILTDELDRHLELITYSAPVPMTGPGTMTWVFQDVQPGQRIEITLLVRVADGTPANLPVSNVLRAEYTNSVGSALGIVRSAAATTTITADFLPLAYILGGGSAIGAVVIVVVYRRYRVQIEDVFLIGRDGILISHLSAARGEEKDEDQLSGMLTAVQDFVQDAFTYGQDRALHELEFGDYHIFIERGKRVYLAVVYKGRDSGLIRRRVKDVLGSIEAKFGKVFDAWEGDMEEVEGTRDLLREGFVEGEHPWSLVKPRIP